VAPCYLYSGNKTSRIINDLLVLVKADDLPCRECNYCMPGGADDAGRPQFTQPQGKQYWSVRTENTCEVVPNDIY
jgi:hypothetical protein